MEKMINVKLGSHVTLRGVEKVPGEVIELDEQSGRALIAENKGVEVDADGNEVAPKEPAAPATGGQVGANALTDEEKAAEIEKQKKALDAQYNLEEGGTKPGLKEAAKAAGVDFAFNANKAEIIEAVVAQGKAAELIK